MVLVVLYDLIGKVKTLRNLKNIIGHLLGPIPNRIHALFLAKFKPLLVSIENAKRSGSMIIKYDRIGLVSLVVVEEQEIDHSMGLGGFWSFDLAVFYQVEIFLLEC